MRTTRLLSGLLVATLFVPLSISAESNDDRAKREVDRFCKTVPIYCSKLSKAEKQAMFKRFKEESLSTPLKSLPEPTRDTAELSLQQKKELTVFGTRAMGAQAGVGDVKEVLSRSDIERLVQAGINLNGHLCAQIVDIRALKVSGAYEVTCIAYRSGSTKKSYVLDALKGVAFEP